MRMMLRAQVDAIEGGKGLKSGATQKAIMGFIEKFKPEAAFFTNTDGERSAIFVFDMKSSDAMPAITEGLFDLGWRVQLTPCMNAADLQKGLAAAA